MNRDVFLDFVFSSNEADPANIFSKSRPLTDAVDVLLNVNAASTDTYVFTGYTKRVKQGRPRLGSKRALANDRQTAHTVLTEGKTCRKRFERRTTNPCQNVESELKTWTAIVISHSKKASPLEGCDSSGGI